MRIERSPLIAALLVALLTVALGAVSFAHRGMSLPDPGFSAYLVAGGSADDLCGDHGAPDEHDSAAKTCEACRLIAAIALPEMARAPAPRLRPARDLAPVPQPQHPPARIAHAAPPTRAPPRA